MPVIAGRGRGVSPFSVLTVFQTSRGGCQTTVIRHFFQLTCSLGSQHPAVSERKEGESVNEKISHDTDNKSSQTSLLTFSFNQHHNSTPPPGARPPPLTVSVYHEFSHFKIKSSKNAVSYFHSVNISTIPRFITEKKMDFWDNSTNIKIQLCGRQY